MQSLYTCPATDTDVGIEIPVDPKSREERWFTPLLISCPACNGMHEAEYPKAYRAGTMAEFSCLPADIAEARLQ